MTASIMNRRAANVLLFSAMTALEAARAKWATANRSAENARREWAAQDILSGRIRAQCVQKLVDGGLKITAAGTAASDHPDYTAYRDHLALLADAKDEAIIVRDEAFQELEEAKLLLQARIEQFKALPNRESVLISRELADELRSLADAAGALTFSMELTAALGEQKPSDDAAGASIDLSMLQTRTQAPESFASDPRD